MSNRTLIEINHDYPITDEMVKALQIYLRSANRQTADALHPHGVTVIGMRHHSGNFILDGEPDGFPVRYLPRAALSDQPPSGG